MSFISNCLFSLLQDYKCDIFYIFVEQLLGLCVLQILYLSSGRP